MIQVSKKSIPFNRIFNMRLLLLCFILQFPVGCGLFAKIEINTIATSSKIITAPKIVADKYFNISASDMASGVEKYKNISPFDMAVEKDLPSTYVIKPVVIANKNIEISADDVAIESSPQPVIDTSVPIPAKENKGHKGKKGHHGKKGEKKQSSKDIVSMARHFWDEESKDSTKSRISISGTKTFEMKKSEVTGDIGHFSTENFDSIPGFHLDQSLHLEIDGNITNSASVHAVLDDKDDEDRRFTINIDGPVWDFVMGDFPLFLEGTEFTLNRKEVRGVLAKGSFGRNIQSLFLFSQSKGAARREQFRGAGQQQEFRLLGSPVVQASEKVLIDGKLMVRGSDYLIDYEDGIIKFLPQVLPIEMTQWIVVEYEVSDENMAFSRNLFGTRQIYSRDKDHEIGLTWLREVDSNTPKSGSDASGTITPMQHDVFGLDTRWQMGKALKVNAETSISYYDPNKNSELTEADQYKTGTATKLSLTSKIKKTDTELTFKKVNQHFRVVGREGGVTELGERGLVNDILTGKLKFGYQMDKSMQVFAGAERSDTNLDNDPSLSSINFANANSGFVWKYDKTSSLEARYLKQRDQEKLISITSDLEKDEGVVVWDTMFRGVSTQAKLQRTSYTDRVNVASDSTVLQTDLKMGSKISEKLSWNTGVSRIAVNDGLVSDQLRSETNNYTLDLNYEPNRILTARGIFQWRREDDYLSNARSDTEIADARIRFEPTRDIRTQLKYKVENTTKILRDPDLDIVKYILPPSLPNSAIEEDEIISTFENPVQKTTANFTTDYKINRNLQAFLDWRHRDIKDQATKIVVSTNDRTNYELRYNPIKNMLITTEYEDGGSTTHTSDTELTTETELKDTLKSMQIRHEIYKGCIVDATYEERDEKDIYASLNNTNTRSKILGYQHSFNRWANLELGLQQNIITAAAPSTEFEKRIAVNLTPFSRSQRYKFFLNHKTISAEVSGTHYEGGVNFSQFIGTDTMIDGEIKKVSSTAGLNGEGYDGLVANAKMVITF